MARNTVQTGSLKTSLQKINNCAELLAANMKHLHTIAGLLALGLSVGYGKGEATKKPPPARAAVDVVKQQTPKPTKPKAKNLVKQKVLFLTNSTFHAHGGCMVPFNSYCAEAGVNYDASGSYKHLESTPRGRRISPFLIGQIKDCRILDLIKKGHFAYVVLVTRYSAFATDTGAKEEIAAFKKMHEHIVHSGARTVVSISYLTRDLTHNADRKARNLAKHKELKVALDDMEIEGEKHPIFLAPTGLLWAEGVDRFGVDAWFADKVHGTPLAQHASGCLFFTFITGKDPRENDHVDLHAEARFPDKQLSREQAKWLRERVWSLYQQQIAKKL